MFSVTFCRICKDTTKARGSITSPSASHGVDEWLPTTNISVQSICEGDWSVSGSYNTAYRSLNGRTLLYGTNTKTSINLRADNGSSHRSQAQIQGRWLLWNDLQFLYIPIKLFKASYACIYPLVYYRIKFCTSGTPSHTHATPLTEPSVPDYRLCSSGGLVGQGTSGFLLWLSNQPRTIT